MKMRVEMNNSFSAETNNQRTRTLNKRTRDHRKETMCSGSILSHHVTIVLPHPPDDVSVFQFLKLRNPLKEVVPLCNVFQSFCTSRRLGMAQDAEEPITLGDAKNWWDDARRDLQRVASGFALLFLAPFLMVTGPQALIFTSPPTDLTSCGRAEGFSTFWREKCSQVLTQLWRKKVHLFCKHSLRTVVGHSASRISSRWLKHPRETSALSADLRACSRDFTCASAAVRQGRLSDSWSSQVQRLWPCETLRKQ